MYIAGRRHAIRSHIFALVAPVPFYDILLRVAGQAVVDVAKTKLLAHFGEQFLDGARSERPMWRRQCDRQAAFREHLADRFRLVFVEEVPVALQEIEERERAGRATNIL